ncbi:MAG: phosphatidate cytidylyltransferase [Candidatus Eisenbacteria bacterium]|nr:phosphatidate cytidylyltransferase [Candidatus Eisenbacteria bacterium]
MSASSPAGRVATGGSSLVRRVVSGILLLPVVLLLVHRGGWPFLLFIEAMVVLGSVEFFRMARHKGADPHHWLGVLAAAALAALMYEGHNAASGLAVTIFFLLVLVLELQRGRPAGSVGNLGATVLGVFYVGWLGGHLGLLRQMPRSMGAADELGARLVYFTLLITWAGDSGAYFVGRWLGRRPLFAAVSPRKTIEGSLGGVAASILAGLVGGLWIVPMLGIRDSVLLGLVAGIVGPIGDLVESLLKRDFGVKDAGELIPGHGGVLDRFDSLFFVTPVVYYYLKYLVFRV